MRDYSPFPATFPQLRADSVRVTHPCATRQPPEGAAAVRLACIKPAASVHPEPGSNSPYYFLVFLFRSSLFTIDYLPILPAVSNIFLRTKLPQHSFYAFLPTPLLSLFSPYLPAKFLPLVPKGDCKCHTILPTYQTFLQKIFKRFNKQLNKLVVLNVFYWMLTLRF